MRPHINKSRGLKISLIALLAALSFLYLGQYSIYQYKLNGLDAANESVTKTSETCDKNDCTATFAITPRHKFLLLGHIIKNHSLRELSSNQQILPITKVRGITSDSWTALKVYAVQPGIPYQITATKPAKTKMDYFAGLLPRSSDHEGLLSIPEISPTIATITGLSLAFVLCAMFVAAYIGGANQTFGRGKSSKPLNMFAAGAVFAAIAAFLSLGILDTILPEGDLRNKILRISNILAFSLPLFAQSEWIVKRRSTIKLTLLCCVVIGLSLACWPWIRGGPTYAAITSCLLIVGSTTLFRLGYILPALIWAATIFDPLRIMGLITTTDIPPVYLNNVTIFSLLTLMAGELGGFATISMAGMAYRRFRRDLTLSNIEKSLEQDTSIDSALRITNLKTVLPEISLLTGAQQVAITINLPLGRPITQTFDGKSKETRTFDDGKIPGAVTLRSLIYGDEAMFESFREFALRVNVPSNPAHDKAKYFCARPLRVNKTIVGTILFTGFDDSAIDRARAAAPGGYLQEERDIIAIISERLAQSLSKLIVNDLSASTEMSRNLQKTIHFAIAASASAEEFLNRFADHVHESTGLRVMIHENIAQKGVAIAQSGLDANHWSFFTASPFNLSQSSTPAYGPTVVGFRDQKSSYVKDISEVFDKLNPKTVEIMTKIETMSVLAVPLKTTNRSFVMTLMSRRSQGPADPAIVSVIEASEALFVAAIEVMSQKTSVLALGQLASRLIGDDEVRGKIIDAAKNPDLPTTIGSARTSFLLLLDLAGSSDLSDDTETKARAYGAFYDAVNRKCHEELGGMIRKTIGDAVIVTWDGTQASLSEQPELFERLKEVTRYADQVAREIGCKGARAVLHHGQYFLGLVGTQTFGQIDVIGSGIDEVCKIEGRMKGIFVEGRPIKLAISATASSQLPASSKEKMNDRGFTRQPASEQQKTGIKYTYTHETSAEGGEDVA